MPSFSGPCLWHISVFYVGTHVPGPRQLSRPLPGCMLAYCIRLHSAAVLARAIQWSRRILQLCSFPTAIFTSAISSCATWNANGAGQPIGGGIVPPGFRRLRYGSGSSRCPPMSPWAWTMASVRYSVPSCGPSFSSRSSAMSVSWSCSSESGSPRIGRLLFGAINSPPVREQICCAVIVTATRITSTILLVLVDDPFLCHHFIASITTTLVLLLCPEQAHSCALGVVSDIIALVCLVGGSMFLLL